MESRIDCAFFGCWGESGHYMFLPSRQHLNDTRCKQSNIPCAHDLDGSHLFLPVPETQDHGRLTYLPAMNVTVLSWWNSLFDSRPGVNSHFIYRSEVSVSSMWHMFKHFYPELAKVHTKPIIGVTY